MSRTKKLGVRRIAGWKQTVAREARELPAMHDERERLDGGGFEVRGFLNFEPRTSNRAFLAVSPVLRGYPARPQSCSAWLSFDFRWVHF